MNLHVAQRRECLEGPNIYNKRDVLNTRMDMLCQEVIASQDLRGSQVHFLDELRNDGMPYSDHSLKP